MIRNYFADLELSIDATAEDIRRAYKRLARRFHPDLNPQDIRAESSFRRITEAYEYLSSATRIQKLKKILDLVPEEFTKKNIQKWENLAIVPSNQNQFFEEWAEEPSRKSTKVKQRPEESLDLWVSLPIYKNDRGVGKRAIISVDIPCPHCRGRGGQSRSVQVTCKKCGGLGNFLITRGAINWRKSCDDCHSKGYLVLGPCDQCSGKGKVSQKQLIEISIPPNADETRPLYVKGFGHKSFNGRKRGDLWVQLKVVG